MITLSKFITEYLSYCEYRKRLNFKTLKSYRIDLNQYLAFCDNSLDFLSKNTLDLYITELHKRYKPKSVKRKIAIEQNRCAMACQGCGAVFLLFLKKAVDYFLKSIYC